MIDIILVVHVLIAVSMIGVILLQRSEGGGLGIGGGGGGGMSGFMTGRGTATVLNKVTVSLAVAFMVSSIVLSISIPLLDEVFGATLSANPRPNRERFDGGYCESDPSSSAPP